MELFDLSFVLNEVEAKRLFFATIVICWQLCLAHQTLKSQDTPLGGYVSRISHLEHRFDGTRVWHYVLFAGHQDMCQNLIRSVPNLHPICVLNVS